MPDAQLIFDWISAQPLALGLLCIAGAAMIEYVFPPFPGDTVVVASAVLIPNAGWPWWAVFTSVLAGSVAGAMLAYFFGVWVGSRPQDHWVSRKLGSPKMTARIEKVKDGFKRHGTTYIAANRFLPAFRSIFFVAAGMSDLPAARVAFFAAVSAMLWNALLMGVGWSVGYQLAELSSWVQNYGIAVGIALVATLLFWWWRAHRAQKASPD
jgi:membrane protein DedA with SNARE-associated domain